MAQILEKSEPVYLRALEVQDLERTHKWHNDPCLYETLVGPFRYVARSSEEEWLRRKVAYSPDQVNLAICLADTGDHIGNIYLQKIDWMARSAELAIFIGDPGCRSRGYGSSALRQIIGHAFNDLGLLRVYLSVLEDNAVAIRAYEKCGFIVEGRLRKHAFKQGHFKDIVLMGVCVDDMGQGDA